MLKLINGFLLSLLSGIAVAQPVAGEAVIPGYTPPKSAGVAVTETKVQTTSSPAGTVTTTSTTSVGPTTVVPGPMTPAATTTVVPTTPATATVIPGPTTPATATVISSPTAPATTTTVVPGPTVPAVTTTVVPGPTAPVSPTMVAPTSTVTVTPAKPAVTVTTTPSVPEISISGSAAPSPSTTSIETNATPEESSISVTVGSPALTPEEKAQWKDYFNKLRSCATGTYVLKQINPTLATQYGQYETDKIVGQDNEKCMVTTMYYKEDDPRLTSNVLPSATTITKYPSGLECRLSKPAVESIINTNAAFLEGKKINPSEDIFSKVVAQECLPYVMINGQKSMVNPYEGGPGQGYNY